MINLKYGVNVNSIILVLDLILNIIYDEKRPFNGPKNFDYKIARNEAYKQIKAYDKSVQFPMYCLIHFDLK